MNGNPGSSAPASVYPGALTLGATAGIQSKQRWTASESDERPLLSAMRAPNLWRVTIHGENVRFRVSWGTSGNIVVAELIPPGRFVVPGAVDVYAQPLELPEPLPAHAEITLTPATSGCTAVMRSLVFGNVVPFDPNAVRFTALAASVVQVGSGGSALNVNLLANQSVMLVSGSTLTSGGGYQEFDP
jgi:hypothetical protein